VNADIAVTIDVIALEGFSVRQAGAFRSALQRELGRLLQERGLPGRETASESLASIDLAGISAIRPNQPERAGLDVARALYRRLTE
jgi:hypothetical protein